MRVLEKMMERSIKVYLKPKQTLKKMTNNNLTQAEYFADLKNREEPLTRDNWIMVVRDRVLVTVHRNDSEEWEVVPARK